MNGEETGSNPVQLKKLLAHCRASPCFSFYSVNFCGLVPLKCYIYMYFVDSSIFPPIFSFGSIKSFAELIFTVLV